MQLDRTHIVIRARTMSEIGDLALVLLRAYPTAAIGLFLLGAAPWAIANLLLLAGPVWQELMLESPLRDEELLIRYLFGMFTLVVLQTPIAGALTTTMIGRLVFDSSVRWRDALRDLRKSWLPTFWMLAVRRGPLLLMIYWLVDRDPQFNPFRDVGVPLLFLLSTIRRGLTPFLPEILLLEQCPWRSSQPDVVTVRNRNRLLHKPIGSDLLGRFLLVSMIMGLLTIGLVEALVSIRGVITGNWDWDAVTFLVLYPAALWMVACVATLIRFISYLDARTRWEGWEVGLAIRAEVLRQFGHDSAVSTVDRGPVHLSTPRSAGRPPRLSQSVTDEPPPIATAIDQEPAESVADAAAPPATRRLPLLLLLLLLCGLPATSHAQLAAGPLRSDDPPRLSAAAGQQQPRIDPQRLPSTPWFDSQQQRLQPISVRTNLPEEKNRKSGWAPSPRSVSSGGSWWSGWNWRWQGFWYYVFQTLGWLFVAVVVGLLVYVVASVLRRGPGGDSAAAAAASKSLAPAVDEQWLQQAEHLPSEARQAAGNLREEAERLMRLQRFDEAIVLLFGHQLLLLDRCRLLRLARGKTNGSYLREARSQLRPAAGLFAATVAAFEASYFGGHSPTADQFSTLWQGNATLEQTVRHLWEPSG